MDADAAYCAGLVRGSDFERYAATLFAAPDQRRALLAVGAFNVEVARVREQVSQPLAGEIRLQWWSDLLSGMAHGEASANPVAAELLRAAEQYKLPHDQLARIVEAHRFDLYDEPMQAMAELERYLQDTAAALFGITTRALGADLDADLARDAGLAFGITRIIAALPRHASRGQLYLPLEELARAGVAPEDVFAGRATPELRTLLLELAGRARQHLQRALGRLAATGATARKGLLPLALVERGLQRVTMSGYEPFLVQPPPSNLATLWTLWRASRKAPFRT